MKNNTMSTPLDILAEDFQAENDWWNEKGFRNPESMKLDDLIKYVETLNEDRRIEYIELFDEHFNLYFWDPDYGPEDSLADLIDSPDDLIVDEYEERFPVYHDEPWDFNNASDEEQDEYLDWLERRCNIVTTPTIIEGLDELPF